MHLTAINLPELFVKLWRGVIRADNTHIRDCEHAFLVGPAWKEHGALVAGTRPYLPGSFGRVPRNPQLKINSGYKAWEYMLYLWALGPAVFRPYLPDRYWKNFCKLVKSVRIVQQRRILVADLIQAHKDLVEWEEDYENLYYQRDPARLHYVRPSIHSIVHTPMETYRFGPLNLVAQWTLENTIGGLVREIKQHSNPFANLSECTVRRAQLNALKAMMPGLVPKKPFPRASVVLPCGFVLLPAVDDHLHLLPPLEYNALKAHVVKITSPQLHVLEEDIFIQRWASLLLPTRQRARSHWKETERKSQNIRNSRNVKLAFNGEPRYGEVQYYFRYAIHGQAHTLAMVSLYTYPDLDLLRDSSNTLYACQYTGSAGLVVVDVGDIISVVAMPPLPIKPEEVQYSGYFYVAEKPFLETMQFTVDDDD
ncbi:hypothetical protein BDN72DRAFT_769939 [Pluteus cervinus]|uniref:Uncharacterized protein n=1 Tax=Pluteus cervinus TaxID=181527 RepID=A0ACD3APZ0_9AGAR|nr:hypothetical protein BDN72DRAFT_769939 [Pluteus cervinus]